MRGHWYVIWDFPRAVFGLAACILLLSIFLSSVTIAMEGKKTEEKNNFLQRHACNEQQRQPLEMSADDASVILADDGLHIGNYLLQLENNVELDDEWIAKARDIVFETPEVKEKAIEELKLMICGETKLLFPLDNESYILRFLRVSRYNIPKAFKLIQRYFHYRVKYKRVFKNLLPSIVKAPFEQNIIQVFPLRDQDGRRIVFLSFGQNWQPSKCNAWECIRGTMLLLEIASFETKAQIAGGIIIFNMAGLSFKHIYALSPAVAKASIEFVQDCLPAYLHAIHVINQSTLFNLAWAIFKPFIDERLRKKINFHGSIEAEGRESLLKFVSPAHLPTWLGGELEYPRITGPKLHEYICEYELFYQDSLSWGYMEST